MKLLALLCVVAVAVLLGGARAGSTDDASAWETESPWSLVAAISRVVSAPIVGALCSISVCAKPVRLPPRPGGPYAEYGPYETRLVHLSGLQTLRYGIPNAVVACPVMPNNKKDGNFPRGKPHDGSGAPGVVWSYGGLGNCDGVGGFSTVGDGWRGLYGESYGYWLPELLEHMASHGIVTVCPALNGVPSPEGAAIGINAARMLAELQPCKAVGGPEVDGDALGIAGYSLGAGRAVRGAAFSGRDVIKAVVGLHTWNGGAFSPVPAPMMLVSSSLDTNAPYPDTKRLYDMGRGPKILAVLRGGTHYTSPRFWAGPMTAFFRVHLANDPDAEEYVWGDKGLEADSSMTRTEHNCNGWTSQKAAVCRG